MVITGTPKFLMAVVTCVIILVVTLAYGNAETIVVKEQPSYTPPATTTAGQFRATPEVATPHRSLATPTPTVGAIPPALLASEDVTLVPTNAPPRISARQAMQVVAKFGIPWALGSSWNGLPITVTASYGLGTLAGLQHVPLPGGKMLDRVVDIPMWIIDYGSTGPLAYGAGCPGCPPDQGNHTVYVVDTLSRSVLVAWFYNDPEESAGNAATPSASPSSEQ